MNKFGMTLTAAGALAFSMLAGNAEAREFADIYTECGLGAMIAPNNEAVAAVTNVTWDLGTTAISSNVSSEESCNGGNAQSASLIYRNYSELERDIAAGQGEHLEALLTVAGVDALEADAVIAKLRPGLAALAEDKAYASASLEDRAADLYSLLQSSI